MYEFSKKSLKLQHSLNQFMDEYIYPNEHKYAKQLQQATNRFAPLPLMDELKLQAKDKGLWNLFCLLYTSPSPRDS